MSKFYVPSQGPESWKAFLADPEKQWKEGYSAYELAHCWESSANLPMIVENVFKESKLPIFDDVEMLYGFPEYKVAIPGGNASSQNDLYVIAKVKNGLLTIMVEGKVSEPFGETVDLWLGNNPSDGKRKRLNYLLSLLRLHENHITKIRYQLLHRTASALIEAKKVNAKNSLMLVHSFRHEAKWFKDYANFVKLFDLTPLENNIVGPIQLDGINLYFGWVTEVR
ncbi:hypothetical protein AAGS61_17210 [Lysinibacillus sp. KU-BSD001]|uniref:DUF6946 family protein n=1 Tax=Lysinibacillus sp. KU-BSD001 TaxID=3141328 RepID=UPI0036EF5829